MDYNKVLQHIEAKFGRPPRRFNFIDRLTWLKLDKPSWDWQKDEIKIIVENWAHVFKNGRITWGQIIQVNTLMFRKSLSDCPGEVLIWKEEKQPFNAETFELVADKLYELKGYSEHLDTPDEKGFAQYLENEMISVYGIEVPKNISGNTDLRVSTVFFQRKHIPNGVITNRLLPIIYLEQTPMVASIVPCKFWPKYYLDYWTA